MRRVILLVEGHQGGEVGGGEQNRGHVVIDIDFEQYGRPLHDQQQQQHQQLHQQQQQQQLQQRHLTNRLEA